MRGSLLEARSKTRSYKRGESTWRLILSLGRDPVTKKWKQTWITFHGTRKEAEGKLREEVVKVDKGEFVEPSKLTVGQYLDEWLSTAIKPRRAVNTHDLYSGVIKNHLKPAFGDVPLQKLSVLHVERHYANARRCADASAKLAPASLAVQHAILTTALKAAVKKRLLRNNVASDACNKPGVTRSAGDILNNVWTADEARTFLKTVQTVGSAQDAALFAVALDSGARKGELLGLQWKDLEGNKLRIERQLLKGGLEEPTFMLPKRGEIRSVDLSDETLVLLQAHKRKQAEVKMANRTVYHDHGLMFAQAWEHMSSKNSVLGAPLHAMALNNRLKALCTEAKVKQIKPHGLRHTCATLSLAAGVQPHVVQRRLGHKSIEMTLNLYAHVLPSQQADAASRLAGLLHRT